jgi:cell wall-associated NlpC family hydrolase
MRPMAPGRARCFATGALAALALLLAPQRAAATPLPAYGSQGGDVVLVQAALDDWGAQLPWSGYFGHETAAALAAVQATAGLPPSGQLDAATAARLGLAPGGPVIGPGSRGPDVQALQRALTRAGFPVAATGLVGPYTEGRIQGFQAAHGLAATGALTLYDVESALAAGGPEAVVRTAASQLGDGYAWGGTSPASGFDCSGLVAFSFASAGLDLPHTSYGQYGAGTAVAAADLQPGDLVFFSTYAAGPSHVGIYVGGGLFIHAADYQEGVTLDTLSEAYYAQRYVGAVDPFRR